MRIARIGLLLLGASASALRASAPTPAGAPSASSPRREILPFIENDYPKAVAEARSKKLPIFAEAWAPW